MSCREIGERSRRTRLGQDAEELRRGGGRGMMLRVDYGG